MGGRDSDWSLLNPNEGGSGARPQAGSGHPSALQRLLPAPKVTWWASGTLLGRGSQRKGQAVPRWQDRELTGHSGHSS